MTQQLLVNRAAIAETAMHTVDAPPLADGQVRATIERFALTANNITYAAFGDAMDYWRFFPTDREGWGLVPVWGFATVAESRHAGVGVGERLWGYWPMATDTVLLPGRVGTHGFADAAPHRSALHPVYNQYLRCGTDAFYTPGTEDLQALLRPLFLTSWLIDDFFADNDCFGARTLLLSSASSKTAFGTAYALAQRSGIEVVGLTSPGNVAFCKSLGLYHRVLSYDALDAVAAGAASAYIDFAGSAVLRSAVHGRFADLKYSCAIGGTHVADLGSGRDLPGPKPTLFFAPAQVKKRQADWGAPTLNDRLVEAWHAFRGQVAGASPPWVQVAHHHGMAAAQAAYAGVLAGRGDPRVGHILSPGAA